MKPIGVRRQSKWQDVLITVFGAFLLIEGVFLIYDGWGAGWHHWAFFLPLGIVDILAGLLFFILGIYSILPERKQR